MSPAIVLLRPQAQSGADARICRAAGWQPLCLNPMVLLADKDALARLPQQWQHADAVFWVSPGAVDMAAAWLPHRLPETVQLAVGAATAARLAAYGVNDVHFPADGSDSEAALRLPYWTRTTGRLLVVRGQGGRAFLGEALRALGWQVDYAEIYWRQTQTLDWAPVRALLVRTQLQAVHVTTVALADTWFEQMPADLCRPLKSLLYFTHHPRVAAALTQQGVTHIRIGSLAANLANFAPGEPLHDR